MSRVYEQRERERERSMGEEKKWRRSWRDGSVAMLLVVVSVVGVLMCRQVVGVHASSEDDDGYDFAVMLADAMLNQQFDLQESILRDYVKYPSVSALHDKHANDTRKCAEWLRSNIRDNLGMIDADLYETDHYNPVRTSSSLSLFLRRRRCRWLSARVEREREREFSHPCLVSYHASDCDVACVRVYVTAS